MCSVSAPKLDISPSDVSAETLPGAVTTEMRARLVLIERDSEVVAS